jgi:hypothetical protein
MDFSHPAAVVLLTVATLVLVKLFILFIVGGGSFARFWPALQAYFAVLRDPATATRVQALLTPPPPEPTKPVKLSAEPLRLLTLLQREGRLLDFLLEDISGATDDQVGAGVRELHRKAQGVVKEHLTLEPVLPQVEGANVDVPPGFDPSAIQVIGNVTGSPPYRGVLRHHGWRVKSYNLPTGPEGRDELVVAPAEVEVL